MWVAGVSDTLWRSVSCSPGAAGHTETAALPGAAIGLTTAAAGNIHFWLDIGAILPRQPAAHAAKYDKQTEALVSSQQHMQHMQHMQHCPLCRSVTISQPRQWECSGLPGDTLHCPERPVIVAWLKINIFPFSSHDYPWPRVNFIQFSGQNWKAAIKKRQTEIMTADCFQPNGPVVWNLTHAENNSLRTYLRNLLFLNFSWLIPRLRHGPWVVRCGPDQVIWLMLAPSLFPLSPNLKV